MDQMECNDCLRNICKNKALRENIDLKSYDKVFYFGDGFNDFCPSKLLQEKDILFCRKGFRLEKMVDSERQKELRCKIVKWNNGFDILNELNA